MSRQYKEFKVGDLFDVYAGKRVVKKKWEEGDIPYVTASIKNNGIDGYIGNPVFTVSNLLTINFFGNTFYHPYEISIKDGTWGYKLKVKYKETEAIYLYLATVINRKFEGKGKYDDALNAGIISSSKIYLPITTQGVPDWQYMEDFMKEIESEAQQTIETLDKISTLSRGGVSSYPEPYGYKEFKVGDLFNIQPTKNYKMINKELFVEGGINPVIVNTKFRNGVGGYTDKECTEDGGIITFSDTTNWESIFYQSKPFVGYPHVQGMYPKDSIEDYINMYNMMYIVTTFKVSAQSQGFDYQNKFNRKVAKELNIKLPITSQGGPDWQYMEDFMRYIEQESEEVINKIQNMS